MWWGPHLLFLCFNWLLLLSPFRYYCWLSWLSWLSLYLSLSIFYQAIYSFVRAQTAYQLFSKRAKTFNISIKFWNILHKHTSWFKHRYTHAYTGDYYLKSFDLLEWPWNIDMYKCISYRKFYWFRIRNCENVKCELANGLRWKEKGDGGKDHINWFHKKEWFFFRFVCYFNIIYRAERWQKNKCTYQFLSGEFRFNAFISNRDTWNWSKFIKNQLRLAVLVLCYCLCVVIALPIFLFVKVQFFVCI